MVGLHTTYYKRKIIQAYRHLNSPKVFWGKPQN